MKKLIVVLAVCGAVFTAAAQNLLLNPEFAGTSTNLGPWNKNAAVYNNEVTRLPGAGPDGKTAIKVDIASCESFKQGPFTMVPGEKYKFGAYVRTKNLKCSSRYFSVLIYNNGWTKSVQTSKIPTNTNGKWVKMERIAVMPSSAKNTYTFCIYGAGAIGDLEICDPYVIPLTEKGKKGSKSMPRWEELSKRVTLHYPLVSKVCAKTGEMWFSVASPVDADFTKYICKVSYAPAKGQKATITKSAAFDKFGCAKLKLGKLPLGKGFIQADMVEKSSNKVIYGSSYTITAVGAPLKAPGAKRLNNFVVKLVEKPLKKEKYTFIAEEDNWYRIAFSSAIPELFAYIDNNKTPVVEYRKGEDSDTMRYLPKGKHVVTVAGKGTPGKKDIITIHKVGATALHSFYPNVEYKSHRPLKADIEFCRKYMWHNINTIMIQNSGSLPWQKALYPEFNRRGFFYLGTQGFTRSPRNLWVDGPGMAASVRKCGHLKHTLGRSIDESWPNGAEESLLALGEMGWLLQDLDKPVWLWHGVNWYNFFNRPLIHRPHIAGISNMSKGKAKILMETYATVSPNMKKLEEQLANYPRHIKEVTSFIPDSQNRFMFIIGSYFLPGGYFIDCFPQSDPKYFFDRYFQTLATDPVCVDLAGIGGYSMTSGDEETFRYLTALMRHYAIEGNKTLFSEKFGYKLNPGHMKDGDFVEGLKHWKSVPAADGSIKARTIPTLGTGGYAQGRRTKDLYGCGDTCAEFIAGSKGANQLSQVITGLTPGKLYSFFYVTAHPDDIVKPMRIDHKFVFNAELSDVEIIPGKGYEYRNTTKWSKKQQTRQIVYRKVIFRAKKDKATVTFTDEGAPAGQKRVLNFVGVRPYFTGK